MAMFTQRDGRVIATARATLPRVTHPRVSQVDAEYFTMSACGIVHVFASEQPSEFLPLSTWMQQSTFFNVLTSIRFFKHYLVAKIFRLWRANVRYKLYVGQRKKLCRRLFLAKPAFCSTLLEINALCYELRTGENTRLLAREHELRNAPSLNPMQARPASPSSRDDKNTLSSGDGRDLVSLCPMLGVV